MTACQYAAPFQAKIVVQVRSHVLLHGVDRRSIPLRGIVRAPPLRCHCELTLLPVCIEIHTGSGWRHTLACAIGSVFGDLLLFSLALIGGRYLLSGLSNPKLEIVLLTIGVVVLFPVGIYFLAIAVKDPRRAFNSARRRWRQGPIPARLAGEAAESSALTVLNPLTMVYWVAVASSWLPFAYSVLGSRAPEWGILMAAAGLMAWFAGLIVFVRFIPHRTGATFFRVANAVLGLILLGFGTYCAVALTRHLLH